MKILEYTGKEDLAYVYIGETSGGRKVEFVESLQPPFTREEKWVIIASVLYGCPVQCKFCDAGISYKGKLSRDEILQQILYIIDNRYPDRIVPASKFKVQFARMGDPAFNPAVLDTIRELPELLNAPGLMPCVSSIAPASTDSFFEELIDIKESLYKNKFQLQFSIHSTDEETRDRLIPVKKWSFSQIAEFGERFFKSGDRKIGLNFALMKGVEVNPDVLKESFSPDIFVLKFTPLNPTFTSRRNNIDTAIEASNVIDFSRFADIFISAGFDVIVSIGETEENLIGSNCGQYIQSMEQSKLKDAYTYPLTVSENRRTGNAG